MLESLLAHSNDLSVALVENAHRWAASAANHETSYRALSTQSWV